MTKLSIFFKSIVHIKDINNRKVILYMKSESESYSVMSNFLLPHGL